MPTVTKQINDQIFEVSLLKRSDVTFKRSYILLLSRNCLRTVPLSNFEDKFLKDY